VKGFERGDERDFWGDFRTYEQIKVYTEPSGPVVLDTIAVNHPSDMMRRFVQYGRDVTAAAVEVGAALDADTILSRHGPREGSFVMLHHYRLFDLVEIAS